MRHFYLGFFTVLVDLFFFIVFILMFRSVCTFNVVLSKWKYEYEDTAQLTVKKPLLIGLFATNQTLNNDLDVFCFDVKL